MFFIKLFLWISSELSWTSLDITKQVIGHLSDRAGHLLSIALKSGKFASLGEKVDNILWTSLLINL